jgi:hypothetical protein
MDLPCLSDWPSRTLHVKCLTGRFGTLQVRAELDGRLAGGAAGGRGRERVGRGRAGEPIAFSGSLLKPPIETSPYWVLVQADMERVRVEIEAYDARRELVRRPAPYCDEKVANRDIRVWHFRDREWLLNDGQIQNPSVQS